MKFEESPCCKLLKSTLAYNDPKRSNRWYVVPLSTAVAGVGETPSRDRRGLKSKVSLFGGRPLHDLFVNNKSFSYTSPAARSAPAAPAAQSQSQSQEKAAETELRRETQSSAESRSPRFFFPAHRHGRNPFHMSHATTD